MECKRKMKEEAPSKKKLPPKMYGEEVRMASVSTPTKAAHDEILSSLLRINNFDSISSIKDESLDIDLSACVTISSASFVNGNSLSSTDFWRVLDESAQNNTELNLSTDVCRDDLAPSTGLVANMSNGSIASDNHSSEFNVTFLRPEPPNAFTNSPFKKTATPVKFQSPEQAQLQPPQPKQRKPKLPAATAVRLKVFKEEPLEEKPIPELKTQIVTKVELCETDYMPPSFTIFQQPNALSGDPGAEDASNMPPPPSEVQEDNGKAIDTPLYKCLDCNDMLLETQQQVSFHEAAAHRLRMTYRCSECHREFEMLAGLKKHLKTHRTEGRKDTWKKCPDCGKCLKLGSMWMHRKIHSDNKKYQCDICGQKFVQKINLTHHARIHSSEKPYECPECQKRFQERSHLQRHQKYHAQTRSYRCEKCGKMYKTERCLKVHNLVHLEQRPFACNVCDKSFISNSKLKQHSNIHTGMRPFKCNYCPRDFTNFPNWLKHTRRRHKVDHKTGEHLENIPSYCSKKSTTTKAQKAAAAVAAAAAAAAAEEQQQANCVPSVASTSTAEAVVAIDKNKSSGGAVNVAQAVPAVPAPLKQGRKKKQPQQTALAALGISLPAGTALQQVLPKPHMSTASSASPTAKNVSDTSNSALTTVLIPLQPPPLLQKQTKAKRERKQLAPKQLQQKPASMPVVQQIKKEPVSESSKELTQGPFPDLHGLSLTSAEDLIMEQALEMMDSGLYEGPVASTDIVGSSDNAISSEAAAALHFQIKNEINDELLPDEEFISIKPADTNRLACPSLESSPFSSPASIELAAVSTSHNVQATTGNGSRSTNNYYLPAFTLNAQGQLVAGVNKLATSTTTAAGSNSSSSSGTPATVSVVNMPLLVRSNQMLPSVDTLLFTSQTGNRFFTGKAATTSSHNMT
ncbi:serendipity locus protein H-1 [Scaptodrosophila lebanonensis]|uniref:Serendipity locus protein H-1 n=1 Tax=Drosophila lebanonensis TaxID=7225 RepID=A0A6J2T104_DROLE|nr:serendipity locus protein H-1 [Scaptodrosophila lebanonensis]